MKPGVAEKMLQVMGGPFLAVLMNVNDVMILKENDSRARMLAKQAKETNGEMGEMLSGMIYICDKSGIRPRQ